MMIFYKLYCLIFPGYSYNIYCCIENSSILTIRWRMKFSKRRSDFSQPKKHLIITDNNINLFYSQMKAVDENLPILEIS